ncbi:PadR family transcriptional regulator [Providencia hangzhouensis]
MACMFLALGVIYPTLTLLEEQGFLESQIVERNRKSFTITPEGWPSSSK